MKMPKVIADYIALSNQRDADRAATYFTDDAGIKDEGNVYKGQEEIKKWLKKSADYNFNIEILDTCENEDTYLLSAKLTGDFPPPNPVRIMYRFKIKEGKIDDLFIG